MINYGRKIKNKIKLFAFLVIRIKSRKKRKNKIIQKHEKWGDEKS